MKRHIVILGAGFSGVSGALSADSCLKSQDASDILVTVLAPLPMPHHAPYPDEAGTETMDALLHDLLSNSRIKYVAGIANKIDVHSRRVIYTAAQGIKSWISYDKLILATGSHVVRPNLEGVEHAFDVNPTDTSACMEKHFTALGSYPDSDARNTVVICGGGFPGLESAKRLPARLRGSLGADVQINVIVIDCGTEIGARMDGRSNPLLAQAVAEQDIEWHVNAKVASLDTNGITLVDGRRIESKTVVWTAGYRASRLTEQVNAERDALGRLHVDQNLQVTAQPDIYAVGDVAILSAMDNGYYPTPSYKVACSMGHLAGHNVVAELTGKPLKDYHPA